MKKLKNKKRQKSAKEIHKCRWEYSQIHSTPDRTVFVCADHDCDGMISESEDSGTGA